MAEAGRRTTSRRDLARHRSFDDVSPEVGVLDAEAFDRALAQDPDDALALLADLTGATDPRLRELARRLAGRVLVDAARTGPQRRRGVGRMRRAPMARATGDLDLDASLDAVVQLRSGTGHDAEGLHVRAWDRPDTALCLLVDRSGSMAGDRLAAAAVAAAAIMFRSPRDCSVVAFAEDAVVLKAQDEHRAVEDVVGDLLRLRGFGVTDVGLALRTARRQLERSRAGRRLAVVMSDCRATTGGDPLSGGGPPELAVLAPAGDTEDARALAESLGARWTELDGAASVPEALARLLGP